MAPVIDLQWYATATLLAVRGITVDSLAPGSMVFMSTRSVHTDYVRNVRWWANKSRVGTVIGSRQTPAMTIDMVAVAWWAPTMVIIENEVTIGEMVSGVVNGS